MRNPITVMAEMVRGWSNAQRGLAAVFALSLCLLLFHRAQAPRRDAVVPAAMNGPTEETDYLAETGDAIGGRLDTKQLAELQENAAKTRDDLRQEMTRNRPFSAAPGSPLIAHTEELVVATKE